MPLEKINIEMNKHRKPFKKYMGPELSIKNTPDLKFYYDNTFQNLDLLSNGFKIRGAGTGTNTSGATYVYMAFAESPFVNSKGVPNNAR